MRFPGAIFVKPVGPPVNPPAAPFDPIAPDTGISATSAVTATVNRIANIPAAGISSTSTVTASIGRIRPISPDTGVNATSNVTATVGRIRPVVPAAINATSTVTASIGRIRPITGISINDTSNVTASIGRIRPIVVGGVNSTSTLTATVNRLAAINAAAINDTSTVTATVSIGGSGKNIVPAQINGTSSVSASIVRQRAPAISAVNSTSTVTGSIVALRSINGATVNATSFMTVVISGGSAQEEDPIPDKEEFPIGVYRNLSDAAGGVFRRRSRQTVQQNIVIYGNPPQSTSPNPVYVVWDNSKREIVSRHLTQADATTALRRRLTRASQDLSVGSVDA